MIVGRAIGWILVLAALLIFGLDLWAWLDGMGFRMISAGELWFRLDRDSLGGAQAFIQRRIWPPLWDPILQTILLWPASLVLGIPGVAFLMAFQRRYRSRFMR